MSVSTPVRLTVGFMPLLDCATLVVAERKGFARAEGLELALQRETSWANIRDRLAVGHFDAAHMLAPMVVAAALGAGQMNVPLIAPLALGLGGNAITVSGPLWAAMQAHGATLGAPPGAQGAALAGAIAQRRAAGEPPLTFAMVFPFSCHNYLLRYWLASAGIDPDADIRLVVVPPPMLVTAIGSGQVDGFCVGEPWNSLAVATGLGCIVAATSDIWRRSPEKVVGVRRDWSERHPEVLAALIRAVTRAARWCDEPEHHEELARLLGAPQYVGVPSSVLRSALGGQLPFVQGAPPASRPEFLEFSHHHANVPWPEHAAWIASQMERWGQVAARPEHDAMARAAFRPDLYREAVKDGIPEAVPPTVRPEGLGTFFDE